MTAADLSAGHRPAIVDAEARVLARTCLRYGVLTRAQLVELSGARRCIRGRFALALTAAIEHGMIRDLGLGFYAPPSAPIPDRDGVEAA
jgi:hypothetical protein